MEISHFANDCEKVQSFYKENINVRMSSMGEFLLSGYTHYPNRWPKGVSGNPAGRKKTDVKVRDLARQNTEEAIRALMEIILNQKANPRTRMAAAKAILDRAWDRPRHFANSKKKSIVDYVNQLHAQAYGCSPQFAALIREQQKSERELDAVIEQADQFQ